MFSKRVLIHVSCPENRRQDTTCVAKPIGTFYAIYIAKSPIQSVYNNQWKARHTQSSEPTIEKGIYDWPKNFTTMSKTTFPCVDLKFEGNTIIQQCESRKGVLRFVDDDHFHFAESKVQHVIHPELHWRLLDRTKHGRIHTNANHIKVEFYIKHGEYVSEQQLADLLAREIEQMGESICDMDIKEEVEKCC